MKVRVCTGWHPEGSKIYGRRFLASFDHFWPKDVELRVYTEEPEDCPREANRSLWDCEGARDCQVHFGPAKFHGRVPDARWKASAIREGYNFRFDAAKFWKQCLIPEAASLDMDDGDILVWLDGDVESIGFVPANVPSKWLKVQDLCYFGRGAKHPEIGFWAVALSPETRHFLFCIANTFRTGAVLEWKEWHSAFIWEGCRKDLGIASNDLTPGGHGHVWPMTEMSVYTRHDKGKRKPGRVIG